MYRVRSSRASIQRTADNNAAANGLEWMCWGLSPSPLPNAPKTTTDFPPFPFFSVLDRRAGSALDARMQIDAK